MGYKFNYGDSIKIQSTAPKKYHPGNYASVVSMRIIDSIEVEKNFNEPIGSILYHVEFGDGSSMEIPEKYLELFIE
jgi:5-methylcytosine-specific restriction endonuclease McrBC GTP-binding regulatory subunit McrB